ncbi:MAG: VWA domain-containing protein [Candidatus Heimdallarchaeota archaeon]|nr:VWA domain-containing protein [Candidatus Heimdallarchaeota archaeon]
MRFLVLEEIDRSFDIDNLYSTFPPEQFASEFCYWMRKSNHVSHPISSRQAIAITKLLIAACFRKESTDLSTEDYIRAAVISTVPEDQETARETAINILFPNLRTRSTEVEKTIDHPTVKKMGERKKTAALPVQDESELPISKDILDNISEFLVKMGQDFQYGLEEGEKIEEEIPENELDFYFSTLTKLEQQPYKALLELLNDPMNLLFQKIKSLAELREHVGQQLLENMNNIPLNHLPAILHSNIADHLNKHSQNPVEQALAQFAANKEQQFQRTFETMLQENPRDAAITAKALTDGGKISIEKFKEMIEQAARNAQTSNELYNVITSAQKTTQKIKKQLFKKLFEEPKLTRPINMLNSLEQKLPSQPNLLGHFLRQAIDSPVQRDKVQHETLQVIPHYDQKVEETVAQNIEKELSNLKKTNQPKGLEKLFNDLDSTAKNLANHQYSQLIDRYRNQTAEAWMLSLKSKKQFLSIGSGLVRKGVKLDGEKMMEHGKKIGCPEDAVYEMLHFGFEALIRSIKKGTKDLLGYQSSLNRLSLSSQQVKIATKTAIDTLNKAALGAIAADNLGIASQVAGNENAEELLLSSIAAGPGEDLLKQWFISQNQIPSKMREKLKRILKKIVIATAMDMAKRQLGSAEAGSVESNQTRPYREGDEFDQLDIEGTLETIIAKGKNPDQIVPDDFMMYELKKGRVALVILLDISGSMSGIARLAYCAFLVTMLIARLREQEIAVALFESNTHAVLELDEEQPNIDEVIDELLEIKARGGTVINQAINWAKEQFEKVQSDQLYFLIASDFELRYKLERIGELKGIQKLKPKTYLVAPGGMRNEDELLKWQKELQARVVRIHNEREIINTVCKILSNR